MEQPDTAESAPHLSAENIAALIDGTISQEKRQSNIRHLNNCPYCYSVFQETMEDLALNNIFIHKKKAFSFIPKNVYNIAASILLCIIAGSGLYLNLPSSSDTINASFVLDQSFQSILLENRKTTWENPDRINRFKNLILSKGVDIQTISKVQLKTAYTRKKSLFASEEQIVINIKNGVATIEIEGKKSESIK